MCKVNISMWNTLRFYLQITEYSHYRTSKPDHCVWPGRDKVYRQEAAGMKSTDRTWTDRLAI